MYTWPMTTNPLPTLTALIDANDPDRFRDGLDTIEDMLEQGQKDALLDYCIRQNRFEEMGLVLLAGANPDFVPEKSGRPLLVEAISRSQVETGVILLVHGASANAVDLNGDAAIHYAARRNLPAVVSLLGRNGADLSIKNGADQDAFTLAAIHGAEAVWHSLLEEGCAPDDLAGLRAGLPLMTTSLESLATSALEKHEVEPTRPSARPSI